MLISKKKRQAGSLFKDVNLKSPSPMGGGETPAEIWLSSLTITFDFSPNNRKKNQYLPPPPLQAQSAASAAAAKVNAELLLSHPT